MNTRRLLRLADFLEHEVKNKWFDLTFWATEGWKDRECGSTACALGWATAIPEFKQAGLKLKVELSYGQPRVPIYIPAYKEKERTSAGASFFGLSYDQASWLFSPWWYPESHTSRRYVAKRIRSFAETQGANCPISSKHKE